MNDKVKLMSEENIAKALFKLGMPMVISLLVTGLIQCCRYVLCVRARQRSGRRCFRCLSDSTYFFRHWINLRCGSRLLYLEIIGKQS